MKKLSEIKVNAAQLKLIIGENINYVFPTEKVFTKVGKEVEKKLSDTLQNIIKNSDYALKRSNDDRFDGKHPVLLATQNIKEVGLRKTVLASIRGDYKCQKLKQITGKYRFLNDLITDEHRDYVIDLLTKTHEAKLMGNPKHFDR